MSRTRHLFVSGFFSYLINMMRLDLRAPLEYEQEPGPDPFTCLPPANENSQELMFCFEIDREQAESIEPQADRFLGEPVQGKVRLAAGLYLFAQERKILSREDCICMAIEQQKDGLWERLRLGNRLYIRRLFEDGNPVTQLFRPYTS